MSEKEKAVLAFFAIASGVKWNKSQLKKTNEQYIDGPAKYEKHTINSHAILTHRHRLTMIKKYADKHNIKIYDGFINSSNSKATKYGYYIQNFHMLCKEHQIPNRTMPQQWGNIEKQPLNDIVKRIISENKQIQHYQTQYDLTMKFLSMYQDNLTLVKNGQKQFEFRNLLKIIPAGNEMKIKTIFENHNQKIKISSMLNQNMEYNLKLSTKNKRKNKKKKFRHKHTNFINTFIKQANQKISCKANELQISLYNLKQNDPWYQYVFGYANKKWNISWNDFVENRKFEHNKTFQYIDSKKTLDEVTQMFNDEENKNS